MKKVMTINEFLNKKQSYYAVYIPEVSLVAEVKDSVDSIKQFCDTTGEFFKGMSKIMYYLFNPKELALMMWSGLVANSLEVCLLVCLLSIMAWLKEFNGYLPTDYNPANVALMLLAPQGAGKTNFIVNLCRCANKVHEANIVIDYVKNCELSNAIKRVINPKDVIELDLTKKECFQAFAFNEVQYEGRTNTGFN